MTEQEKLTKETQTGSAAREILESPVYQGAVAAYREELLEQWENSPARDAGGREQLWLMIKMLTRLTNNLESLMMTGKMATEQLLLMEARAEQQKK